MFFLFYPCISLLFILLSSHLIFVPIFNKFLLSSSTSYFSFISSFHLYFSHFFTFSSFSYFIPFFSFPSPFPSPFPFLSFSFRFFFSSSGVFYAFFKSVIFASAELGRTATRYCRIRISISKRRI